MSTPQVSVFEAGSDAARHPLVLLHGSDGTESDLLTLADRIAPGGAKLAVRGAVALDQGYAFFRRHDDHRVDEADISSRVPALASLIRQSQEDGVLTDPPVVVGFSNGAIMAAALVATVPNLVAGAILFRPLSPFASGNRYRPSTVPVLIIDGAQDHRRAADDGGVLAGRLRGAGAMVTHHLLDVGHAITAEDEEIARAWLSRLSATG